MFIRDTLYLSVVHAPGDGHMATTTEHDNRYETNARLLKAQRLATYLEHQNPESIVDDAPGFVGLREMPDSWWEKVAHLASKHFGAKVNPPGSEECIELVCKILRDRIDAAGRDPLHGIPTTSNPTGVLR